MPKSTIKYMGAFDPGTQRRVKNIKSALLLPAAEVLPHQATGGVEGLAATLDKEAEKLEKKNRLAAAAESLRADAARLRDGGALGGADRYLCAVYPEAAWGLDYLPTDAVVFFSETGRVEERIKGFALQAKQDTEALLEAGVLAGTFSHLSMLLLSGCGKQAEKPSGLYYEASGIAPDAVLLTVDGREVPAARYFYWLTADCDYLAEQSGGTPDWTGDAGGQTLDEYVKEQALSAAVFYATVESQAESHRCVLTAEDLTAMVIRVPSPTGGYMNLGDTVVLLGAFLLGPWYGALAGGIGSAMADALAGYMVYAPATLVIKAVMAILAGLLYRGLKEKSGGMICLIVER